MPARRLLLAVLVAIGLLIAPAAATAKERLVAVHVCGVDRCVALPSQAFGPASAILTRRFFRRPAPPAAVLRRPLRLAHGGRRLRGLRPAATAAVRQRVNRP